MQPSRPNSAQPGRAPAPPDRRTPPVSGNPLSCALPLSRSLPSGADLSVPVSSLACPSSLPASRARIASRRAVAPSTPLFSVCVVGLPYQFCPLRARRGLARAHSHTSPDFSAMMPAHASQLPFRSPLVPRAHPSPHFAHPRSPSRSALTAKRRQRPMPAFPTVQAAGDRARPPRAPPRGETPVPMPNFPYCALCPANFDLAGSRPRRTTVLARWPADLARSSSPV